MAISLSTMMAIADFLQTQMHRWDSSLSDLINQDRYKVVLEAAGDPNHKAKQFRQFMREETNPTLQTINESIQLIADDMALPESVQVNWDPTLENREVSFAFSVQNPGDLTTASAALSPEKIEQQVTDMLDKL